MHTKHIRHGGQTLPMQGVTYESAIRFLLAHEPSATRDRVLGYFAQSDQKNAGEEYDRQTAGKVSK